MASKLVEDPRIDPRLKEVFHSLNVTVIGDVTSREDLFAEENTEAGEARAAAFAAMLNSFDNETIAPSAGLRISTERAVSDAWWQSDQHPVLSSQQFGARAVCLLHSRRRNDYFDLLLWKLPGMGQDDRDQRCFCRDGRLSQCDCPSSVLRSRRFRQDSMIAFPA
jgi:hypothetical protein